MQREALVPGVTEEEMIRLLETYSGVLLGVCSLILGDHDMAQDIVQETFLKAWKRHDYQRESEKAWLIRVAVNLCHDYHRSRWWRHIDHRLSPEELPLAAPEEPDTDIIHLVRQLPMKEREVIILFFWNNMSADEIAATLGITRSAVYRRLEKAKQHLKLEMEGG
ncbi:MAG: sigma-70 family RNA polymerase sigma factor [Clostridia bacterium]|nr:sigma-70 family RNA polymerase sigma factor [Clostridia bacterium]